VFLQSECVRALRRTWPVSLARISRHACGRDLPLFPTSAWSSVTIAAEGTSSPMVRKPSCSSSSSCGAREREQRRVATVEEEGEGE